MTNNLSSNVISERSGAFHQEVPARGPFHICHCRPIIGFENAPPSSMNSVHFEDLNDYVSIHIALLKKISLEFSFAINKFGIYQNIDFCYSGFLDLRYSSQEYQASGISSGHRLTGLCQTPSGHDSNKRTTQTCNPC